MQLKRKGKQNTNYTRNKKNEKKKRVFNVRTNEKLKTYKLKQKEGKRKRKTKRM